MWENVHWLGHASFRIDEAQVIYIDPWKLKQAKPADLILVTHGHGDHLSLADIARISQPDTVVVCPPSCAPALRGASAPALQGAGADAILGHVRVIAPGESLRVGDVLVEAVPSYNTNKPNHPKAAGNLGYIVEVAGQRIYHAGDTDLIPEMSQVRCDLALLPTGGTYTMDAKEAAQAVARIKPKAVVPMHWGDIVGSKRDVERFKRGVPDDVEVLVLQEE